ncbi:hypothetical protein ACIGJO_12325 [Streptomyces sp. NPDC079020]|uniref:hypothetical protein n=1 Tax=Streptomyces sp. NPDC079020 TaxID=3365722 RepID=UPI0037D28AE8
MKWLDEAVACASATTPAHPSRVAVLDAVRADRSGPVAAWLLQLADSDDPFVRRETLLLLQSLVHDGPWPRAAEAATVRLTDPDEAVRREAARLLVRAGRDDLAALAELTDPVARTALAEALGGAVGHLRGDASASVRFLAHLETLRTAPPAHRPAVDAALFADAREAGQHVEGMGERWGRVLYGLRRERHTYDVVARLLDDPATRDTGAGLARSACHAWRAAPVELVPLLVRHCGKGTGPAVAEALATALISEEAKRVHDAATARVTFTPYPKACGPRGGAGPSYDSASAAGLLAGRPMGIGRLTHASEVFRALLDEGPLTFRQAAQLYNLTFRRPGRTQAVCAPLWLRHAGPRSLPGLLALMVPHIADYAVGEYYLDALARMGHRALPVLPAVTAMIDRRTRIPVNDSTRDGEMELDERLLRAALGARRAILTGG